MLLAHEVFLYGPFEHLKQRIKKAVYVQNDNRIQIQSELFPCDDLKQFFQSAASARQGNDAVAQIRHLLLAFVHGSDFDQFRQPSVMPVLFDHEVGDNTCHFTAILQNCVGYGAHQSDASGTVYQTDMLFGKQAAEFFGCFKIYGGYLSAGCAVYAYGMYLIHCLLQVYWMNGYKSTKKSYTYQNECAIYVKVKIEE